MDLSSTFALMNPWWEKKVAEVGIPREKYLGPLEKALGGKKILFITGLRRVGKTTILKQTIQRLLQYVAPPCILYLTLDFITFRGKSIHELLEIFRQLQGHTLETPLYLFLDEITNIPAYEQELKNLYDLENVHIVASSSSASLLKSKNSYLVGRSELLQIEPLDFDEFLLFRKSVVLPAEKYLLKAHFESYLAMGGLPEYVLGADIGSIKNTVEQILYKDIIALHDLKDKESVEKLFLLLCERVGKPLTYAKLARVLSISIDSVRRYVGYFHDTFLFYSVQKYAQSLNERTYAPKKMYIADNGIRTAFIGYKDKGALFENLVFLQLKNASPQYFMENGKEIDFIVKKGKETIAIEAKYKEETLPEELTVLQKSKFTKKMVVQTYEDLKRLGEIIQ